MDYLAEAKFLKEQVTDIKSVLTSIFKNNTLDFNYRWQHYLAWYDLGGSVHTYCWYGWNNIIPGHDEPIGYECIVHADRYQTIDLVESIQNIIERLICNEDTDFYTEYCLLDEEGIEDIYPILENHKVIVALKEQLMKVGISSVYYDW